MKYQGHLYLDEVNLTAAAEWAVPFSGWCFLRLAEGQGYWLGDTTVPELNTGDVLVLFPIRKGVFRASQLSDVRLQFFRFCPELLAGFLTVAERHSLETLAGESERCTRFLPASHPAAVAYGEVAERARTNNGLLQRCQVLEVVSMIFVRPDNKPEMEDSSILTANKRLQVLMNQLTEAEVLSYSSTDLASRCGCSLRHFSRLFLTCFGVSFRAKQTELRLLRAQQLLDESNMKVLEVARASGYRHLGLFNASFKKRFGMTPTECRQRMGRESKNGQNAPKPSHGGTHARKRGAQ